MTLEEFELLSDPAKLDIIWQEGQFVKNYAEGNDVSDLYKLHELYVGVTFDIRYNSPARIFAFDLTDGMNI